jgi:hypothetical protein
MPRWRPLKGERHLQGDRQGSLALEVGTLLSPPASGRRVGRSIPTAAFWLADQYACCDDGGVIEISPGLYVREARRPAWAH